MRTRLQRFLAQPDLTGDGLPRLLAALLLTAGGVFFFRVRALPVLAACVAGGGLVLTLLWSAFHRLGLRPLGPYWPGVHRGLAVTLLAFCLMPPGIPAYLAALLAALAVGVEAVERKALVPLAFSGVTAAWLLAGLWQARTGSPYIAPFDFHVLDEPVALWVRFDTVIDPVRAYAGQVAGPLGATSFGLAALGTLLLSYAGKLSWHTVLAFYIPIGAICVIARLPLNVYLFNAPALVFAAVIAADARRLPRTIPWRVVTGFLGGAVAAALLLAGSGYMAFGFGVALSTALVTLFQLFGLAGAPGLLERPAADGARAPGKTELQSALPAVAGRTSAGQLAALVLFMPAGLALVWRDPTLERSQRAAVVAMGGALYFTVLVSALLWLWLFRFPA